ncbi:MAG: radical SAM protein [Candidatus Edwardsbacteria bacterium]|nr:radical SAM protein [Candidatus Edwardsbacteria bacterium]
MIKEITAKTMLSHVPGPDNWFGLKYNMNLYRGCAHGCIYCDSRSSCYRIENFSDILVKTNAIELLKKELPSKRVKGTIGTGSMNDPYQPVEKQYQLTRKSLELMVRYSFPVHMITKSDLVLRDIDLLRQISKTYAAVTFTVITTNDQLAAVIEPGAPLPSQRLKALEELSKNGIYTGITMMPLLPFITDTEENVKDIVRRARDSGAKYIIPVFGMSIRQGQREYYYQKLDEHFPDLKSRYEKDYGQQYQCPSPDHDRLGKVFLEACDRNGLRPGMEFYQPQNKCQPTLF